MAFATIELEAYYHLCDTFDFLCVTVLQRISLDDIIKNLKVGKGKYEIDYKYSVFVKGNKALARDAAFLLVCTNDQRKWSQQAVQKAWPGRPVWRGLMPRIE
jgi:hypothetical protein